MRADGGRIFEQARYVMPLISLYALALALAFSWLKGRAAPIVVGTFTAVCMV